MKRRLIILLAACVFIAGGGSKTEASKLPGSDTQEEEKIEYNQQQVDNFTGITYSDDEDSDQTEVMISENGVYNRTTGLYTYYMDVRSGQYLTSTVADGMYTNDVVSVGLEGEHTRELYKDGELVEDADLAEISLPGTYVLFVDKNEMLSFTIVGEYSKLSSFSVPSGFSLLYATLDGNEIVYKAGKVAFEEEGAYSVYYECDQTEIQYSFDTVIDHTPPVLKLEAVEKDGKARGPVDLSDAEEENTLTIMLDGEQLSPREKLTQSGKYTVTITDPAGNSSVYNFIIMVYFNGSSIIFLLLIVVVAVGITAYILISRKRLRVF